jgi:ABC-type polysaccharide/polyol phosphate export permease
MQSSELIYDSASRKSPAIKELKQLVKNRKLIYQLIRRDILTRYKPSV